MRRSVVHAEDTRHRAEHGTRRTFCGRPLPASLADDPDNVDCPDDYHFYTPEERCKTCWRAMTARIPELISEAARVEARRNAAAADACAEETGAPAQSAYEANEAFVRVPDDAERSRSRAPLQIPSGKDIFLCYVQVAGTPYYDAGAARAHLDAYKPLILRRQPDNPHDAMAIEVLAADGSKLGYIPRIINEIPARLLDRGKKLFLEVVAVEDYNNYLNITAGLYMWDD